MLNLVILSVLATAHPRYDLNKLPQNSGYAISLGYNSRLQFVVPFRCHSQNEVSHTPSKSTQPGLNLDINEISSGRTRATLYVNPNGPAPAPGTLYTTAMTCDRPAGFQSKLIGDIVIPFDVTIVKNDESSTRSLAFFLDEPTAKGFAESEITILRSAQEACEKQIQREYGKGIGHTAKEILKGFQSKSSRAKFRSKIRDLEIYIDRLVRTGDELYIVFRTRNSSNTSAIFSELHIQMGSNKNQEWSLNVQNEMIQDRSIPGLLRTKENDATLKTEGMILPGHTSRSVLAIFAPQRELAQNIHLSFRFSDGREIKGQLQDLGVAQW